jgi:hypothetical protein
MLFRRYWYLFLPPFDSRLDSMSQFSYILYP